MTELKKFTLKEVKEHNDSKSTYFVIYDQVYDVTKFLEEVSIFLLFSFFAFVLSVL